MATSSEVLLAALALFTLAPRAASADVDVVATVPDLAALATEIGGEHVEVKALSLATQDPHYVDAKPSLALALNKADLLIAVGLDLEVGWLPTLQTGARNAAVQTGGEGFLDCSTFIDPLDVPKGKVDRTEGDLHPSGNPHYLFDPRRALACARGIAGKLAALDPKHADDYRANLAAFERRLGVAMKRWQQRMAKVSGKPIISYHKSFIYLTDWLDLNEIAYLEPKAGVKPSPRHVARVLALGKNRGVKTVLLEAYYPDATARLVAQKLPARLVKVPGGTSFPKQGYIEHMDRVIEMIATALGG